MATLKAPLSLLDDDDDAGEHFNDPQLLALLDQPALMAEADEATTAEMLQRSPLLDTQPHASSPQPAAAHCSPSPPTVSTLSSPSVSQASPPPAVPSTAPSAATAASTAAHDDLIPASYATLPFPLPVHVPTPCTGWSLLHRPSAVLSLGCGQLDALLDGGLRPGVTELVGEAGAGKSQICFQLLLQVQLALPPRPSASPSLPLSQYGLDGCGFYIVTEGRPPMTRLQQLQEAMHRRFECMAGYDFLANVFLQEAHSVDQLLSIVEQLAVDPSKVREQRLRLLIIDSVAGLFRLDDEVALANSAVRADAQFRLSSALRRLSGQQQMVVLVCNQVTDRFLPAEPILRSTETYRDRYTIVSSGRQVMPALGLSWANCIDTRLAVSRRSGQRGGGGGSSSMVLDGSEVAREMEVMFAPHLPRRSVGFVVDADGVRGVENSLRLRGGVDNSGDGEEWTHGAAKLDRQQQQQSSTATLADRAPLTPISVNVPVSGRATPCQ